MSAFQDAVYQATWNQQVFQGQFNNNHNNLALLVNPPGSGKNIMIVSYVISNLTGAIINLTDSTGSFGPFSYTRGPAGVPLSSANATTNLTTGVKGNLVFNTAATFNPGTTFLYGTGGFSIQALSSVSLYGDVIDPNLQPIILYPGDVFGDSATRSTSNIYTVQLTTVEL